MHKPFLITLLFLIFQSGAYADDIVLRQGIWPGVIKLPGREEASTRVYVDNTSSDDEKAMTRITMYVEDTPIEFADLTIRKDKLEFRIDTGTTSECIMRKQSDGTYTGYCARAGSEDKQQRIELSMRPPREEEGEVANPPPAENNTPAE